MNTIPGSRTFRILVVDDNDADTYLLRRALIHAGLDCDLTVIDDGAEALAFANRQGKYAGSPVPNLSVIDLNLPKYGGNEILKAIRQNKDLQNLPVVVMTSSAAPGERARIEELGVERFITKPPELEDFMQIGDVFKELLVNRPDRAL